MTSHRIAMSCPLTRQGTKQGIEYRGVRRGDQEDLAILLYAAYRGTVDDDGGTYADARQEIDRLYACAYGEFLPGCSFVIEEGEFIASASLITWWKPHRAPLIAFTMTRPEYQRRGYAIATIRASMNALIDRGDERLTLVVTDGNERAQQLYARLGFRPISKIDSF